LKCFLSNNPYNSFNQNQPIEMSSSRTYNNNNSKSATATIAATPFCKVCRDAGKNEKEYTSHFVKDQPGPNGKVVCPTLLNQACRICGKTGHTSSYCSQYRNRQVREEPRREPRREERYIEREPRREERYIEREREREREPRRDREYAYDRLRDDTERHERDVRERDEQYQREQERRSKPWLQAAIKPATAIPREQQQQRREPYAHPHGPRVRLNLETTALCASKHAAAPAPAIDIRKVELHHAANWGDEDNEAPFVCNPEEMTRQFFEEAIMSSLTTAKEHDFIEMCDDQSQMPFECGQ
jgi:hypothetical protein